MDGDPGDGAMDERLQDPAYALAYDVWLVLLARRAALLELRRTSPRDAAGRAGRGRGKPVTAVTAATASPAQPGAA